jgi:tripartite-type tricarboxylate transporter receptor subunit TctC
MRHLLLVLAVVLAALAGATHAQPWPARPVRLIVPYPAGGPTDAMARMIAERAKDLWGQPVVVENRPGAGGNTGTHFVAQQPGDGHTLLISGAASLAVNVSLFGNLPYDPRRDFAPITKVVDIPTALVVTQSSPVRSVDDLIAAARARPGALNFGSPANGTANHLLGEVFKQKWSLAIQHIPYKGNPQALEGLLRGDTDFMFDNLQSALPQLRAGKLRALAVTGPKRVGQLPDIPTMAEQGASGFEIMAWFAIMAPRGLPRDLQERLNRDIVAVIREPEFARRVEGFGMQVASTTPDDLARIVEREIMVWGEVVRASGAKPD